jgi:hypothetical protein
MSASVLTTLGQGTSGKPSAGFTDASGNGWYQLTVGSKTGWARSDFFSSVAILPKSGDGYTLQLPATYTFASSEPDSAEVENPDDPAIPFLTIRVTAPSASVPDMRPKALRHDIASIDEHNQLIEVYGYSVLQTSARTAIDTCQLRDAANRPDQGWPYTTYVKVTTAKHNYLFFFVTPARDTPSIKQVLQSAYLT